jgi:hypothetical protein
MIPVPIIAQYQPDEAAEWDRCVCESEGACLLFYRSYMDYHSDRFADASLTARLDGRLVGVFPASASKDGVCSHGGLTFGGWQFVTALPMESRRHIHTATLGHYRQRGHGKLAIRVLPRFFLNVLGTDDRDSTGMTEVRTLTGAAVDLSLPEKLGVKRRPRVAKALESHEFSPSSIEEFWPLLVEVLAARHGVPPVHTLEEMKLLQKRFPDQILAYKATQNQFILAGAIIYLSRDVAHVQYMATSLAGRATHALDALLVWLMRTYAGRLGWLSLGISNERDGQINQGLLDYKLSFGAMPFAHDIQEYDLSQ